MDIAFRKLKFAPQAAWINEQGVLNDDKLDICFYALFGSRVRCLGNVEKMRLLDWPMNHFFKSEHTHIIIYQ